MSHGMNKEYGVPLDGDKLSNIMKPRVSLGSALLLVGYGHHDLGESWRSLGEYAAISANYIEVLFQARVVWPKRIALHPGAQGCAVREPESFREALF